MPTYAYRCPSCGHDYDKFQKISDRTAAKCPECGTRGERVITGGAGFVFKGSGFYITDYKRKGNEKGEGKGESEKLEKKEKKKKDKKSSEKPPKSPGADH